MLWRRMHRAHAIRVDVTGTSKGFRRRRVIPRSPVERFGQYGVAREGRSGRDAQHLPRGDGSVRVYPVQLRDGRDGYTVAGGNACQSFPRTDDDGIESRIGPVSAFAGE